jgi:hypothetical protein
VLADLFDQLFTVLLRVGHHLGRNVRYVVVGTHRLVLVGDGLHTNEVDDAPEFVFAADGELNRYGITLKLGLDLRQRPLEVRADAVHLVDEADARDAVLVGLTPDGFRLRLDAGDGVEHGDRAVEDPQRALDFGGEIDVTGRVDDVDPDVAPEDTWSRRR